MPNSVFTLSPGTIGYHGDSIIYVNLHDPPGHFRVWLTRDKKSERLIFPHPYGAEPPFEWTPLEGTGWEVRLLKDQDWPEARWCADPDATKT